MKIIAYSNFDIETESEWTVAKEIVSQRLADIILEALCDSVGDNDPYYYKLVDDDYVCYRWEP